MNYEHYIKKFCDYQFKMVSKKKRNKLIVIIIMIISPKSLCPTNTLVTIAFFQLQILFLTFN